ncbi:GNAT family N-acetyltransferase [Thalassorhabdus alkalitolerans]|uniref:GNAT family N-acetyltransferase n=1 Tax=Thalassorhabdus alkalitolerans TaxID=2282697 RepID=UPI0036D90D4B
MIEIREVKPEEIDNVAAFLLPTMAEVYPFPLSDNAKKDITEMEKLFITRDKAIFLAAFSEGNVLGTIAVRPYDDRITALQGRYCLPDTCELIKCYVKSDSRKQGIGSRLYERAVQFCSETGYQTMYLHTHEFLPGGLTFWKKKGFLIVKEENDRLETVHMEKKVPFC